MWLEARTKFGLGEAPSCFDLAGLLHSEFSLIRATVTCHPHGRWSSLVSAPSLLSCLANMSAREQAGTIGNCFLGERGALGPFRRGASPRKCRLNKLAGGFAGAGVAGCGTPPRATHTALRASEWGGLLNLHTGKRCHSTRACYVGGGDGPAGPLP